MNVDTASLESMCELIVDCPHSTPKWTDSGVVVLRNQNIRNGQLKLSSPSYTNEAGYQSRVKRAVPQVGDIIFTREAPMGEVCLIPSGLKCCLGQRQVLLRPKETVNGEYLYWALQSPFVQHQISWNEGTGTTVSNVRIPVLKSLQIPRRGSDEQKIADALSSLAHKIRLNHQINQTLEQIAQALFKSWFVDFEPVKAKIVALEAGGSEEDALLAAMQAISGTSLFDADASAAGAAEQLARLQAKQPRKYAELRATAEMFPSTMQESELGEIPEGWDIQQIGEILDRLKPKKRYTKKQVTPTGQTPVFEQGSDILLGFHNGIPGFIATSEDPAFIFGDHTCIIHLSCQNFDVSQNVIPLKGKVRSTMWTYYALQGKQTFQDYRRHWAELVVKPVIYPPNALCKQFSETINSSIRLKEQLDQEAKSLSEIRDLLLPKLLSGQLSVSGTANCVPEVEEVTDV